MVRVMWFFENKSRTMKFWISKKGFLDGNSHFVDGESKKQKFFLRHFDHTNYGHIEQRTFSFNIYHVHERNKKILVYVIGKKKPIHAQTENTAPRTKPRT